jgi:hypothetical protein
VTKRVWGPPHRTPFSATLTAAVDTPSPRASALWLVYTPWSSIRRHSRARHPTSLLAFFLSPEPSVERRGRTRVNEV